MTYTNELRINVNGSQLTIRHCLEKVVWFCENDAYKGYDLKGYEFDHEPDVFQRELLIATNTAMRARSSVKAWQPIIGCRIPELAALPTEADLIDTSDADYAVLRANLGACYKLIIRRGIADVAASKMLHLKRPKLVAISDGFVKYAVGLPPNLSYPNQALEVSDRIRRLGIANRELLDSLQSTLAGLPEPIRLSKIRLLDILIWMYMAKEFTLYNKIFDAGCIKFGEFKLKSGIMSPVYCDFRGLISKPELLKEIGEALASKAKEIGCDRIAGIPYAGLPLGVAASIAGNIPMIYPRKEAKDYGTKKLIEGAYNQGDRVLVIDDIITDGASKIEAIAPLKEAGLIVTDVLIILDREQGGDKILAKAGYTLHSLGKLSEVLDALVAAGKVEPEMRAKVAEFIAANQFA